MSAPVIDVSGLVVEFGGLRALDGLDLGVEAGELRFLIGPNGAGKTTLLDVLTGLTRASAGTARLLGQDVTRLAEHRIVGLGVGRTFQTPTVFDALTVAENLDLAAVGRRPRRVLLRRPRGIPAGVEALLDHTGMASLAERPAAVLSHGQRQWLEIGMLLSQDPAVLLLDEPVAGMTRDERHATGELLDDIAADRTVVVVEHDMEFLRRWARRVTVLHEGRVLAEGSVTEVQEHPRVREVYLGRPLDDDAPAESADA